MKVLKKKLKKVHGAKKFFYFISIILYVAAFSFLIYNILKLKTVETTLRLIALIFFGTWFLIYILCGLVTMVSKKDKSFIFITFITLVFAILQGCSSYIINYYYNKADMTNSSLIYTTNLITLKETTFNDKLTIGMIETESDVEGNVLAKKLIEKENLTNKITTYEDYPSMLTDLYKGKIGGCFVSSNYAINFRNDNFDGTEDGSTTSIEDRVKVVYEYSEEMANQDAATLNTSKTKTLTEPFTVLIMGVDSDLDGLKANQAFNGDTLIMVTFNPNTLTATMFSIPRDMYVPIACNHNRYAKINSSAAYGSSCVISTVEQLTDVEIDYYVKMNFKGVVDLVDALGGITVDIEEPDYNMNAGINCNGKVCEQNSDRAFGKNTVYIDTGVQEIDGEQALAYARCRHLYASSDIARNQHQQQIIEAIAQKLKTVNTLTEFNKILDAVTKNLETNMTNDQIISFYTVGKDMLVNSNTNSISIQKTYLTYYSLPVYQPSSGSYTSALGYYSGSLDAITKLMKVNLELEEETPVKTFSISYDEEYTTPLVGQNIYTGTKLETMKSLIGETTGTATSYCTAHSLKCSYEYITDSAPYGQITDQTVHEGILLKNLSSTVTFYVSNGKGTSDDDEDDEDDEKKDNKDDEEKDNKEDKKKTDDQTDTKKDNKTDKTDTEDKKDTTDTKDKTDSSDSKTEPKTPTEEVIIPSETTE